MSTVSVSPHTNVHTVTHVTSKMLLTLKEIIREIGLNPDKLADSWASLENATSTWLVSQHLTKVVLEVFNPDNDKLVVRWDLDVVYGYEGDGSFWADTFAIKYAILKAGQVPSRCRYDFLLGTKLGRPDVVGWGPSSYRATEGFERYGLGATVGAPGIGTNVFYWSKS